MASVVAVPFVKVSAPPLATDTVTAWFGTGFPERSATVTTGTVEKVPPLCTVAAGWVVIVAEEARPAATVMLVEGTLTTVPAANWRVLAPVTPVATRPEKVATPLALVVAVPLVNVRALPEATDTATATGFTTALPRASLTVTTGTDGNATPFWTVAGG